MTSGGPKAQAVGSVTLIDSIIENTPIGILTSYRRNSSSMSNGSLILENVSLKNVGIAVQGAGNATALAGTSGSITIAAWGQGHKYNTAGHTTFQGDFAPFPRPSGLLQGQKYYERTKPSYADIPTSHFVSARSHGAKGDAMSDDTAPLQQAINAAVSAGKVLFVDAGIYRTTRTIHIPAESRIVGESYPIIMSSGPYFANMNAPKAVVRIGDAGEKGCVEWSDMIVSTQGHQAGAILIEWNLSAASTPSGMWDVHTRIGGFKGSHLQFEQCPPDFALSGNSTSGGGSRTSTAHYGNSTVAGTGSPSHATGALHRNFIGNYTAAGPVHIDKACIAAFMSMHIRPSAQGLYMENVWLWTADHDMDSTRKNSNITIYTGRGLFIESTRGNIWLVATAAEHHSLYQFQFASTQSLFASQLQTESAYYQPHPDIRKPFSASNRWNDPIASEICKTKGEHCDGLGLRVKDSQDLGLYGAGLYSFYDDYNVCKSRRILALSFFAKLKSEIRGNSFVHRK
ncbi:MAG: hypothetical protein Q9191_004190 [Dirinaria sp. TL-2023a]